MLRKVGVIIELVAPPVLRGTMALSETSHAARLFTLLLLQLAQLGRVKWSSHTELPQPRQWCRLRRMNARPQPENSHAILLCRCCSELLVQMAQWGRSKWSSQTELPQARQWCRRLMMNPWVQPGCSHVALLWNRESAMGGPAQCRELENGVRYFSTLSYHAARLLPYHKDSYLGIWRGCAR